MNFTEYSEDTKRLADSLLKGDIPLSPSHKKMIELVSPNSSVLEIGCANGFMSAKLKEKGCKVTGVEIDREFARKAEENCTKVITGNIEDENTLKKIKGEFNHILFGDILEHLEDPMKVINALESLLLPDGSIIASLPNIAIWWMRRDLLLGKFIYTDTGLLDRTHLRFFSFCTAKKFFQDCGLKLEDCYITSSDFPLKRRLIKLFPALSSRIENFGDWLAGKRPNLFGFHFVFMVKKPSPD